MSNHPGLNAALFNFCNSVDDGPREARAPLPPRDPAELQWLREALAAVEAPERTVKRLLETLLQEDASDEVIIETLEELSDIVEDLNWAVEFVLMNGHTIVLRMLECDARAKCSTEIRRLLAMVIAHASQQNDKVQAAFNSSKWADVVLPALRAEDDKAVVAALLHACSCMCRECDAGSVAFLAAGGMDFVHKLLSPSNAEKINEKIALRVLFLVSYFSQIGVSSEALIENVCYQVSSGCSEEVSSSAAKAVQHLLKKSPALVHRIASKSVVPFLDGIQGASADDARVLLRSELEAYRQNPSAVPQSGTAAGGCVPLIGDWKR